MTAVPAFTAPTASRLPVPTVDTSSLGIDEFASYALVIDARTPHEYAEDHIPGAVNLPVVDDAEFAEVGTKHASDPHEAYLVGASYASRNLSVHLRGLIGKYRAGDRMLVYCFRGGKRSRAWGDTLRNIGFETDVLKGGWKAYRAWVRSSLERLPPFFEYRVVSGLTGCGKTRLLHALEREGGQVLDLEGLASHRGSLLGGLPDAPQPTQKHFDTLLLEKLRSFDPARPVWVEAESKKVGDVQLPTALFEAMRRTPPFRLHAPMHSRVRLLREDYPHLAEAPEAMVAKLTALKPLVGGEELAVWQSLAQQGEVDKLFERLLVAHYDPSYQRSRSRASLAAGPEMAIHLAGTEPRHLAAAAADLMARWGRREGF